MIDLQIKPGGVAKICIQKWLLYLSFCQIKVEMYCFGNKQLFEKYESGCCSDVIRQAKHEIMLSSVYTDKIKQSVKGPILGQRFITYFQHPISL